MWRWFGRNKKPEAGSEIEVLRGAPAHARTKTYSAETGFVYQYVYRGYRLLPDSIEFVFEASRSRNQSLAINIRLCDSALAECARQVGRELLTNERYAIAKMTLFAAFDEYPDTAQLSVPLIPHAQDMERHLRVLGRV